MPLVSIISEWANLQPWKVINYPSLKSIIRIGVYDKFLNIYYTVLSFLFLFLFHRWYLYDRRLFYFKGSYYKSELVEQDVGLKLGLATKTLF